MFYNGCVSGLRWYPWSSRPLPKKHKEALLETLPSNFMWDTLSTRLYLPSRMKQTHWLNPCNWWGSCRSSGCSPCNMEQWQSTLGHRGNWQWSGQLIYGEMARKLPQGILLEGDLSSIIHQTIMRTSRRPWALENMQSQALSPSWNLPNYTQITLCPALPAMSLTSCIPKVMAQNNLVFPSWPSNTLVWFFNRHWQSLISETISWWQMDW